MRRISIMISLLLAGCWSYKHEGFLDATTPDVPNGLLKGYYVRRFSTNYESSDMNNFSFTGWLIDGPNIPGRPFWVMRHRTPLLT